MGWQSDVDDLEKLREVALMKCLQRSGHLASSESEEAALLPLLHLPATTKKQKQGKEAT